MRKVKVVGRFSREEKRKSGVHFKLQFCFADGQSITVPFHAMRACMLRGQHAQERRALRKACNTFVELNPSIVELQTMREQFQAAIDRINQQREENMDEEACCDETGTSGKRQHEAATENDTPATHKRPRLESETPALPCQAVRLSM